MQSDSDKFDQEKDLKEQKWVMLGEISHIRYKKKTAIVK